MAVLRGACLVGSACLIVLSSGCGIDDAFQIFRQKGIVPLQPARNTVTVGGVFVVGQVGKPGYINTDPGDPILTKSDSFVPGCVEVFGDEQQQQTMEVNLAISAIAKIIPFAAGLKAKNGVTVHLQPFTSPCMQLNERSAPPFLAESGNRDIILTQLHKSKDIKAF